jgi:exodeoxyribonuclease-3
METLTVCTFNVNSIKARKDLVIEWLERRGMDIDVLRLQELKGEEETFPCDGFERLGYRCEVFGQKALNGVALCSKGGVEDVRFGLGQGGEDGDPQARVIAGRVKGLRIINVYAPHGDLRGSEKYHYKLDFFEELVGYLDAHYRPTSPVLLVGDMNVAREDVDV